MPFRILSIDGGGLRGIIPLKVLEYLQRLTGKSSIADSFDLIAGTSTGGIIACALSLKVNGIHQFTIQDILKIYTDKAKEIFPDPAVDFLSYVSPKYAARGLERVLESFFGQYTLQDCKTPVLISAYDINNYTPFYYTSRFVTPLLKGSIKNSQFRITDICRSTSAAPTYFPSHYFSYLNDQTTYSHNMIDGGVFVNNPSLAALTEVLKHKDHPLYNKNRVKAIQLDDIYILSLGTGIGAKSISKSQGASWGKIKWASKLFDIMMQGNSQSVDSQMERLLNEKNYLRLNVYLPPDALEMDDSSDETRAKWIGEVNKGIINNAVTLNEIDAFVKNAAL